MKVFEAKYPGFCQVCRRKFSAGTQIQWGASEGSRHISDPRSSQQTGCPPCSGCSAIYGHDPSCSEAEQAKAPAAFHRQPYFQAQRQAAQQSPTWKQDAYPVETEYDLRGWEVGGRGTSYFAVPYDGEGAFDAHWFVRIDVPKDTSKYAGNVFVKWVYGETEKAVGRQFPGETFRFRKGEDRFDYPLNELCSDPEKYKSLYGQLIGKCGNCHKRLTDETSRKFGIGPECRKMLKYWSVKAA